ncbi:MAG: FG-GAP-like repeat-containing protein [Acidobacteriota bacterium]
MLRRWTHIAAVAALTTTVTVGVSADPSTDFLEEDVEVVRLLTGDAVGDYYGWVVGNVGDTTGDGIDDFLVPAIAQNNFAGRVTLYSGSDGAPLNVIEGAPGALLGYSLGAAGDVNGDGIADYIVGGGQVLVVSGADHHVIHDLTATVGFGNGVRGAGDVDGDGHGDLVVGFRRAGFGGVDTGRVFMISGADGSVLWTRDGAVEGDLLGDGIGTVGDVNWDGVPDVVAGSPGAGPSAGGEALVLSGADGSVIHTLRPTDPETADQFGAFFASGAGDVNGDGVGDVYIGDFNDGVGERAATGAVYIYSGRTGRVLHVLRGRDAGELFGLGRGIPDVNGDGHADILVGAPQNSDGVSNGGATYLFSGRSGALLRKITGTFALDGVGNGFGADATSLGDVDGDGLPDFLVSAGALTLQGLDTGRAYVVSGTVLPCPADLDGDGWVGLFDFLVLRYQFGDAESPADLDGDGEVGYRDLRVLIRDIGWCPAGFPR